MQEKRCRGDVGAVREADGHRRREPVFRPRLRHESGKIPRATADIRLVEHAFGEPPEEAGHPVLQDRTPRREQSGTRREGAAETDQIVLIAAGAVQQEKRRGCGIGAGLEAVMEAGESVDGHDGLLRGERWFLASMMSASPAPFSIFGEKGAR